MIWQMVTGIIAACVGVTATVIKLLEFRRDRARVRVSFTPWSLSPLEGEPRVYCLIGVVNAGRRPVTVQAIGLQYKDGTTCYPGLKMYSGYMPATLNETEEVCGFIRHEDVKVENVLWAFAKTSDGKRYRSPKYKHARTP